MSAFKRKLPLLLGAALIAGLIGSIFLLEPQPRDTDLLIPATRFLSDRYRAHGHAFTAEDFLMKLLRRDAAEGYVQVAIPAVEKVHTLHLARRGSAWHVQADLLEAFTAFVDGQNLLEQVGNRLVARLARLHNVEVTAKDLKAQIYVMWDGERVFGQVEVPFDKAGASTRYLERWRFEKGSWIHQGEGQLFESTGPRRR